MARANPEGWELFNVSREAAQAQSDVEVPPFSQAWCAHAPKMTPIIGQVDTEKTTAAFKALGLPVSSRSPEYVAPATFSKYVREGLVADELIKKTTEAIVVVH